jgi:hypothetical protein
MSTLQVLIEARIKDENDMDKIPCYKTLEYFFARLVASSLVTRVVVINGPIL